MKLPCKRTVGHHHVVAWVNTRGRREHVTDRCRSLHLWSTLCFHVLAGDPSTLDGKPFTDRSWAERYLEEMSKDTYARGTAKGIRTSLSRRAEHSGKE